MGCGINILINLKENGLSKLQSITLLEKTAGNTDTDILINMDLVVELLTQLPSSKRTQLAAMLRVARSQSLTEKDCKEHLFVSNTDIETLQKEYPDLAELYPNLESLDNYTLVRCSNMRLNGKTYFGRVIQANGLEAFFLPNKQAVIKFFNYLDIKSKIQKSVNENTLNDTLKEYQEDFSALIKHFNKSGVLLLLDYLDNLDSYTPYKEGNKYIIPSKTLNTILSKILNTYNSDLGKSDLELAIASMSSKKHDNRFEYKISLKKLHQILSNTFQDFMSFEEFNRLPKNELLEVLHKAFSFDARLRKYKIKEMQGGLEKSVTKAALEKKVTQKLIQEKWKKLQEQFKSLGIELGTLKKMASESPSQVIGHLKSLFSDLNPNITILDGKINITYQTEESLETKETPKTLILESPYSSLGLVYDFGYDSNYLFSPVTVENGADELGMYHGMYLYLYYNPLTKLTHYAISRSIISPNSYAQTFNSIEGAKAKIDDLNRTLKLNECGLYSIKLASTRPRTVKLEMKNVTLGLIITVLDLQLPRYGMKNLPTVLAGLFDKPIKYTHALFSNIEGIESMNTPEKAAAFIYLFTLATRTADNAKVDINQVISENSKVGKEIVDLINKASTVSYLVEEKKGLIATLTYLENNGNKIDVSGKFDTVRGDLPSVYAMELAVEYFGNKFGVQFHTMTSSELSNFETNTGHMDLSSTRAFIYNGEIYINSSNANLSDIFHEMAHIFFGVLKAQYPESYQHIMTQYSKSKKFNSNFGYISKAYSKFAYQDKVEECVVDMIADLMFQKQRLINGFKGEDFLQDLEDIFTNFPKELSSPKSSGLAFDTYMSLAIKDSGELMKRNMKISNLIESSIKNGTIKEKGC